MRDRYNSFIKEVMTKEELSDYITTFTMIVNEIKKSNCKLYTRCDITSSSFEQSKDNGDNPIIRISLKEKREKSIHIIWDLLHEFGHYLSGVRQKKKLDIDREIEAWLLAEKELVKYPKLVNQLNAFRDYKEKSIETYKG